MTRPRTITRLADCRDCRWGSTSANAQAGAAQHHDRTGHTVEYVATTVYGDGTVPVDPGQTDILTALTEQDAPQ